MSPLWTTVVALASLLVGGGGVLAWVKFFRTETHVADAGIVDTIASAKLKEAQATEVIAEAFTNTLASVRQLAEDRAKENAALRVDVGEAQKEIAGLKADVARLAALLNELRHFLSDRGEHGEWDERALDTARQQDPDFPAWPPAPPAH